MPGFKVEILDSMHMGSGSRLHPLTTSAHGRRDLLTAGLQVSVLLACVCVASLLPSAHSGCWKPAKFIEHKCGEAVSNPQPKPQGPISSGVRRLLWHGGGAEYKDIPDHIVGEGQLYRGDGGTLHNYELTGEKVNTPGSPDFQMIYAFDVESRFYRFCEGRADRGLANIFGQEDSWWEELLECSKNDESLEMCQLCGNGCSPWEWETTGYSLLNGTELEVEDLTWMTHNTYITKSVILPLSVCAQFDWWICIRRLDESTKVDDQTSIPGMPKI